MNPTVVIDVRAIPPRERHPRITSAWDALPVGDVMRLVVDHEPKPLFYEFNAERAGTFRWDYRERGPETWVVEVARTAPDGPSEPTLEMAVQEVAARWPKAAGVLHARGLDMCCGGVHPVAMAAKAHGVDAQALLAELKEAARTKPREHACCCEGHEKKEGAPEVVKLDVSHLEPPEPMVRILSALPTLEAGQVLEVEHHREPVPLYPRLEAAGFSHEIEKLAEGRYRLRIRRRP